MPHTSDEARLRYQASLLDNISDAVISTDAQFNVVSWNKAAEAIYGWREDEMLGKPIEILQSEFRHGVTLEDTYQAFLKYGFWKGEVIHHHRDQSPIFLLSSVTMLRDNSGQFIGSLGVNRDISEHYKHVEALQASQDCYHELFDNANDIIYTLDMHGNLTSINKIVSIILGYTPDELAGRPLSMIINADNLTVMHKKLDDKLSGEERTRYNLLVNAKDGSQRTLEISSRLVYSKGEPVGIQGIGRDITRRIETEEALRRNTERLKVLNGIQHSIIEGDPLEQIAQKTLDGIRALIPCNRTSIVLFDWETQQSTFFASSVDEGFAVETVGTVAINPRLSELLKSGQPLLLNNLANLEAEAGPYMRKLMAQGIHSILNAPLLIRDNLIGLLGISAAQENHFSLEHVEIAAEIAFQLTIGIQQAWLFEQQKRYTEDLETQVCLRTSELQERSAELERTNQELEAFSYSVSHDLRAPLRSINGFSYALLQNYSDRLDETGCDYLQRVRTASVRMGQLIDDLLNLSRVTRAEMHKRRINLGAIVRAAADDLTRSSPEREVEFIIANSSTASGDHDLLRIALENLLGNAWKFTSRNPKAIIEFGVIDAHTYYVRDNGVGFNMTYANKLFAPFQRLHTVAEFPGTGIGLATVERIIHRHGGRVWAESEMGKGAAFYFTL